MIERPTTLVIDGDILAYKAATKSEYDAHWGDGLWTVQADENQGKYLILSEIDVSTLASCPLYNRHRISVSGLMFESSG